jgi:hypothetical protein
VGFPIRKSTGHRLFAPHRSLSQRTTSFIASCRQGIHRMLLGHLIALISNAHLRIAGSDTQLAAARHFLLLLGSVSTAYRKTSLQRDRPKQSLRLASSDRTTLVHPFGAAHRRCSPMPSDDADRRPAFRAYPFFTMSRQPLHEAAEAVSLRRWTFSRAHPFGEQVWWSQTGSNRRPPACKAGALPTELWPRIDLAATSRRSHG